MEKTFGQMEEANKEAQSHNQTNQDETSTAVANLTSILEESTSPGVRVSLFLHILPIQFIEILIDQC